MPRPVLLVVDADEEARQVMERDLDQRYGARYRVLGVTSGHGALEALRRLRADDEPVALLLVDQRLPDMTGIELLERASTVAPDAKRTLLTTYRDAEAVINALKRVRIDHYVTKPWQPPERNLYPMLDDLLTDWEADSASPSRACA